MSDKLAKDSQIASDANARELQFVRHALDQSAIVAVTDKAGRIIHVNDKFCQISQYSREELLGQNHRIINSGHHGAEFFENMWKTIASGQIWEGEVKNRAKQGSFYWVHTTIVPFLDESGRPFQYVSIRYEITQRKVAEAQLRIYADRLESSNKELQDFASIAAHDLHEPLRKIQAFGDRLESRFATQLSEEGLDYLKRMLASAKRMRSLIDDLLTYSRVTTKSQPFSPTDLNLVLSEVLSDLEFRVEQSQAIIETEIMPTLDADASQLRQLFQNLIGNALKFHRKGVPPSIKIKTKVGPQFCTISIEDNGIGFDQKYLDKIFTIFQRLHGRAEYEGTGVGLAVCRKIVERHGGQITARSSEGQGATFIFTLLLKH